MNDLNLPHAITIAAVALTLGRLAHAGRDTAAVVAGVLETADARRD